MKSYEERREERRRYENDVFYQVWRSGGNPDRIDYDRVSSHYYDGMDSDSAANAELRAQRPKPQPVEECEPEPEEQFPPEEFPPEP